MKQEIHITRINYANVAIFQTKYRHGTACLAQRISFMLAFFIMQLSRWVAKRFIWRRNKGHDEKIHKKQLLQIHFVYDKYFFSNGYAFLRKTLKYQKYFFLAVWNKWNCGQLIWSDGSKICVKLPRKKPSSKPKSYVKMSVILKIFFWPYSRLAFGSSCTQTHTMWNISNE